MNYIEMAVENSSDDKTRQILGRAQEASTSLIQVMEDLLRLTKVESTNAPAPEETFNLSLTGE
jgi:signal transduction histidine kinase